MNSDDAAREDRIEAMADEQSMRLVKAEQDDPDAPGDSRYWLVWEGAFRRHDWDAEGLTPDPGTGEPLDWRARRMVAFGGRAGETLDTIEEYLLTGSAPRSEPEVAQRASDSIVVETIVEAGLSFVPVVGGALSVLAAKAFEMRRRGATEAGIAARDLIANDELFLRRITEDERLAHLLVDALAAAARTALAEKRRMLGQTVGRAVLDDAAIDRSELVVAALQDLDAVHFRLLEELERISERRHASNETELISEETRNAADQYPTPVRSALIGHGAVDPATLVEGGTAIARVTMFGRELLADVRTAGGTDSSS